MGMPFLREQSPLLVKIYPDWRRIPLLRRVFTSIGRFASAAVRQVRYYRAPREYASGLLNHSNQRDVINENQPRQSLILGLMHKTPLRLEQRFAFRCWSLASQQIMAGGVPTVPVAGTLGRSPLWRVLLPSVCFFVGWPELGPAACTSLALFN